MNLGLLVLRLVAGGVFLRYGGERLGRERARQAMPTSAAQAEPVRVGWPATVVAVLEIGGGLLLLLGLVTFIAALLVSAAVMIGLLVSSAREARTDQLTLLLLAAPFTLTAVGPGKWSLDHPLGVDWIGAGWALLELGLAWIVAVLAAVAAGSQGRRAVNALELPETPPPR